jgi:hypothetical protein
LPSALFGGGDDGDVHATGGVDLVVVDLREDQLLGDAERVVATAVEAVAGRPRKSRMRGMASVDQAVEELPHAVAAKRHLAPMGLPSRSLKPAIDFFALVTTGFWPAMILVRSATTTLSSSEGARHGAADSPC